MKGGIRTAAAAFLFSLSLTAHAGCAGRVMNPVTDVCWSCLFPIKAAGLTVAASDVNDPVTDAEPVCTCGAGVNLRAGLNLSFFEPVRTAEIVREPYCFPSLGGVKIDPGIRAAAHGRSSSRGKPEGRRTAFYQVHWYHTPWLFLLEVILDTACLENAPWDLAYMTELDPLWDDSAASFILAPESAIFANPVAAVACAADCTAAALGKPVPELFWCSGCQGNLYPLTGWVASSPSHLSAWQLLSARMSVKLAREGVLWAAYGKKGQCGPYFEPIPRKDVWRTQLVYPTVTTSGNTCCKPLGYPTLIWGAGKTYPGKGEDGAVLMWRKRDCCQPSFTAESVAKTLMRKAF